MIKNSSDPNVGNLRAEVESHQNYPRKLNIRELRESSFNMTRGGGGGGEDMVGGSPRFF